METRSSKRRRIAQLLENEANAAIDRISDLPDDILHQILCLVSIKCVAQMSVLSKRWKFLWYNFPYLDFTTLYPFDISSKNLQFSNSVKKRNHHPLGSKPMDFITQALSIRHKHSDITVLSFRGGLGFSRLNSLFRSAIKHNVRELDIEVNTCVTKDEYFNFPRCVIGSESLRVLKLKSGFRLPPPSIMRDGFKSLHTLSLSLVILYNQPYLPDLFTESSFPLLKNLHLDMCFGLKYLHVGCRSLQDLSIEKCFQLHGLDISCAKLEKLKVKSSFDAYSKKSWVRINAPKLEHLFWQHNAVSDTTAFEQSNFLREAYVGFFTIKGDIGMDKVRSVNSFLSGLFHVGSMVLESQTIEILSNNNFFIPPFQNLKSLELNIGFSKSNVQGLACLFRSSLMLHTLIMKIIKDYKIGRKQDWNSEVRNMTSTEEEQYWESQIPNLVSFLQHLKVVKIHRFFECESEVTLAKFLLKHGKALEEMILHAGRCNAGDTPRRQEIRSQMMAFSWASSNAKLVFH